MARILLVHGPNLNILGLRNAKHYGFATLPDIEALVAAEAQKVGYEVKAFQSNHEGALIDFLQKESASAAGIIINAGALAHYSYTIYDALVDTKLPCIEVHLSDVTGREEWRKRSVLAPACIGVVLGKKEQGYAEAVLLLAEYLKKRT
ncbi:hypothetical protein A2853_01755 [Candidatus Kaiserbacteria bacterium RIFCSPHIGHO2_01_FULL_55_17]|uniref:3-dehydroquinate dehydratase n=1 Tax=Candidatus Kaiserbacteria bacterium RIFCSPHIGHO2_01_FULL_55_17 TaxID=1798484 RepID=A0A1F6D9A1_9BACT|nr:MAG: hypothetical protein A2853_01755 [Candidatus Kaiserbacteria bacterium RIFCSPHIGHO2_01_FULL_55_17]